MRITHSMAVACLFLMAASMSTAVSAQTGPLEPRMVVAAMPSPLPKPAANVTLRVPLDLEVAPDGHVAAVTIRESSGDTNFDEKVRKYYSKIRFVPALDDQGKPMTMVFRFSYKYSADDGKGEGKTESPPPPPRDPGVPGTETISTGGIGKTKVFDEVDRISRMHCKDFLWEYDLMKDIAGARSIYDERMLRTSLAMFIVHKSVKGDEINAVKMTFSETVRGVVNDCRKRPDAKYFLDVLAPALEGRLKR